MSRFEHPLGENAELWVRARRQCIGAKAAAVSEGPTASSLRAHWAGVPWTRQAECDMQLAVSTACLARGAPSDSSGR
eukprot:3025191-Pyramimonas_sp.AAC.1